MLVVKTDSAGDSIWIDGFGGGVYWSKGFAAVETVDGGYAIGGIHDVPGTHRYDFLIVRVDSAGDTLWSQVCGRDGISESVQAIRETADGGFIAAGSYPYYDEPNPAGLYLVRLDAEGNILWTHSEADSTWLRVYDMEILPDSSFVVAGELNQDVFVMRFIDIPPAYPPGAFERIMPVDSNALVWRPWSSTINFLWTASQDPDGDVVSYIFHLESPTYPSHLYSMSDTVTSDTAVTVGMYTVDALDEVHDFYWTVHAVANFDTVEASNGEGYFTMDLPGTVDEVIDLPTAFGLNVYPNPFNSSATFEFSIPQAGEVQLILYDITGREVKSLTHEFFSVGMHEIAVDAAGLPSGVLFARLTGAGQTITRKLVLMR
jgi:hypothetical protein